MIFPENLCLSTLGTTRGQPYSSTAVRMLWGGRRVSPILPFAQAAFSEFRRESAPRISLSGVQDKISLRLIDNVLTPTDHDGEFILKPIPRTLSGALDLIGEVPANEIVLSGMED